MELSAAIFLGYLLDLLFGDPHFLYHPVRLIGLVIAKTEEAVFRFCKKERQLLLGGAALVILVTGVTVLFFGGCLWAAGMISGRLRFVLEVLFCYWLLAVKSLRTESRRVYERLAAGDLSGARKAVSMIVGRDTLRLNEEQVAKAAVETVAENTSDGVAAPLFYMAIGGPILGFFYKAVNTMDSMVGYKNERYLYFGRAAAKLDDVLNFLPSRLCAGFMILASFLLSMDGPGAVRIFKRDRFRHKSPNSAQTESVCAGALGVQLAGDAWYFGKRCGKETIGDAARPVEPEDILRAGKLLSVTAFLMVAAVLLLRAGIGSLF